MLAPRPRHDTAAARGSGTLRCCSAPAARPGLPALCLPGHRGLPSVPVLWDKLAGMLKKHTNNKRLFLLIFLNATLVAPKPPSACPGPSGEEEQWLGALRDAAGQAEHPAPWGLLSVHFQKAPGTVKGLHQI